MTWSQRRRGPSIPNGTPCIDCERPMRPNGTNPDGRPMHMGLGLCQACRTRRKRHEMQPPGAPRAASRKRAEVVEEYVMLRQAGETDVVKIAARMGMKPLSMKRQLARARARGELGANPATQVTLPGAIGPGHARAYADAWGDW